MSVVDYYMFIFRENIQGVKLKADNPRYWTSELWMKAIVVEL